MPSPAPALLTLRYQLYAIAPGREPHWHGIMGDRAHRLRRSAHNRGDALDMSTTLLGLYTANSIVEHLRWWAAAGEEPRLARMIWARRSCQASTGWQWVPYRGINRHELHAHIEIHARLRGDPRCWALPAVP